MAWVDVVAGGFPSFPLPPHEQSSEIVNQFSTAQRSWLQYYYVYEQRGDDGDFLTVFFSPFPVVCFYPRFFFIVPCLLRAMH